MKGGDAMAIDRTKRYRDIKNDLLKQLQLQNKTGNHYLDLVEQYMRFYVIKEQLDKDIQAKGIRYMCMNGNGIEVERPNESVDRLLKITPTMTKLLDSLGLKEPIVQHPSESDGGGYF